MAEDEKKIDVKAALEAYEKYSSLPYPGLDIRLFAEATKAKDDADKALKELDPKNEYRKKVKKDIEQLEQVLPHYKSNAEKSKKLQDTLKSYFDAGGRKEIVDETIKKLNEKILKGIKDEKGIKDGSEDETKYKALLEQAYNDLKTNPEHNDAYLALTSKDLKSEQLVGKTQKALGIYRSLVDRALGGDGKGEKVAYYSTPAEAIQQQYMKAAKAEA